MLAMRRLSLTLILMSCCLCAAQAGTGRDQPSIQTGTLNVVLANRNGVVIATDSRRSSQQPFDCHGRQQTFCDDSQKLFKTGTASALAIAGFASGGLPGVSGTPLNVEVSSFLRRRFGSSGIPDQRGNVEMVTSYAATEFVQLLPGLAGLFDPSSINPKDLSFFATVAGIENGVPKVAQVCLVPQAQAVGRENFVLYFDARPNCLIGGQPGSVTVEHFIQPVLVGCSECTEIPSKIVSTTFQTHDPAILAYYSSVKTKNLDNFTTAQMEDLARAMLRKAAMHTDMIGGDAQVIVFPIRGEPSVSMPLLPSNQTLVPNMVLTTACVYSHDFPNGRPLPGPRQTMTFGGKNWAEAPMSQYFLADEFENVTITLDNNYLVGDSFNSVTFNYFGSKQRSKLFNQPPFVILRPKFIGNKCKVALAEGINLPPHSGLEQCDALVLKINPDDDLSIGHALKPTVLGNGHISTNEDGSLKLTVRGGPNSKGSVRLSMGAPCRSE
jgi:hypothetical protein